MIGHENDAERGESAAAESGGSVPEQHHSPEVTDALETDQPAATQPAVSGEPGQPGPAQPGSPDYTPAPVSRKPLGCLIEIAETLILTLVIFWVIQTFVAQPYRVEQQSMETTLLPNQYVLVDKLTKNWDSYSRGDVVVFYPVSHVDDVCSNPLDDPSAPQPTPFIKRVIGEPGDNVTLRAGKVYVNGVMLDEPYVHGAATEPLSGQTSWNVEPGRLFVMGDNRLNSTDSRSDEIGEVCINDVIGRAVVRYWPLDTIGILQTPTYPGVPSASPGPEPTASAAP